MAELTLTLAERLERAIASIGKLGGEVDIAQLLRIESVDVEVQCREPMLLALITLRIAAFDDEPEAITWQVELTTDQYISEDVYRSTMPQIALTALRVSRQHDARHENRLKQLLFEACMSERRRQQLKYRRPIVGKR